MIIKDLISSTFEILTKRKIQKNLFILASVILISLIFFFNYIYPNAEDDWTYAFIWSLDGIGGRKILSFSDLFESQYAHYMLWGGRTVAHTIAQLLLTLKPIYQDILNTFVYYGLMVLIYKYANINKTIRVSLFILICFLFWFFQPIIFSTSFWITGSANYLWCTFIVLLFVYPFYNLYINENGKNSILKSIFLFLTGIIAGWTNENTILAIIFLIISMLIILKYRSVSIPNWAYWGFLGLVIGCLFLFLSPGNIIRYNSETINNNVNNLALLDSILLRLKTIGRYYRKYLIILSLLSIVTIIYYYIKGTSYQKQKIVPILCLLFISAHVALFAMLGTPIFPERAMFGLVVLLIILLGIGYANIDINIKNIKVQSCMIFIFLSLMIGFVFDYHHKYKKIYQIHLTLREREEIIRKGKKVGVKDYIFDDKIVVSSRYHYYDLLEDPKAGKNLAYSCYHGINSVIVIDHSVDTIRQDLLIMKARQDSVINRINH